jgi:hypothetical protein
MRTGIAAVSILFIGLAAWTGPARAEASSSTGVGSTREQAIDSAQSIAIGKVFAPSGVNVTNVSVQSCSQNGAVWTCAVTVYFVRK